VSFGSRERTFDERSWCPRGIARGAGRCESLHRGPNGV